jgi:hypothetical protein
MPGPLVGAAVVAGKLATKKAIKILKDHGVKAKLKDGKIKAADVGVKKATGKNPKPIKERTFTKIKEFSKNPTLKSVKDFLGYKKGGLVSGKPKIAKKGWK